MADTDRDRARLFQRHPYGFIAPYAELLYVFVLVAKSKSTTLLFWRSGRIGWFSSIRDVT